ncbi:UDP-2,4-diacetamido-2,4,6-trideoxy-beta-L-altropyranose hydrolase [Dokdonia sp. PRO95]|uniref:UDP-2,4-diacetamido-2,4, 6-trideoxy-beta-L-altropyranose hydrolase n=1 Tax=Dokdonia sp. PRO95 TaxID=1239415 RepID=UPI00054E39D4|nr:UDP-2,4-diacetamido-2,4,6-trideoxy-beta-L-altropyranose hydrolase [Dokdonia sp. PRO95]
MEKFSKVIIRCNAGMTYGLGHLSRCLTLSQEFQEDVPIIFLVKTDYNIIVDNFFLENNFEGEYLLFSENKTDQEEIDLILSYDLYSNLFLVLDHYDITVAFQKKLIDFKIKWLQFDSHAKIYLYANFVLHGSLGATPQVYNTLKKNDSTTLLLGPKYSIVKKEIVKLRESTEIRTQVNKIVICFGGGNDHGLSLQILKSLATSEFTKIRVRVAINENNPDKKEILKILDSFYDGCLIKQKELANCMASSDLCIIAPGMISYEAACLGLPMLLVPFVSNQIINAEGWINNECALSIGADFQFDRKKFCVILKEVVNNSNLLQSLSKNCYNTVDGLGAYRTKNIIEGKKL